MFIAERKEELAEEEEEESDDNMGFGLFDDIVPAPLGSDGDSFESSASDNEKIGDLFFSEEVCFTIIYLCLINHTQQEIPTALFPCIYESNVDTIFSCQKVRTANCPDTDSGHYLE